MFPSCRTSTTVVLSAFCAEILSSLVSGEWPPFTRTYFGPRLCTSLAIVTMSGSDSMSGAGRPAFCRRSRASGMLGVKTVVRGRMCSRRLVMASFGSS